MKKMELIERLKRSCPHDNFYVRKNQVLAVSEGGWWHIFWLTKEGVEVDSFMPRDSTPLQFNWTPIEEVKKITPSFITIIKEIIFRAEIPK